MAGAAGVVAHAALLLAGLAGALRGAKAHSAWLLAFALALLAFQGVGLIDSVIDSPRFLQLYLTIALLAWSLGYQRTSPARGSRHGQETSKEGRPASARSAAMFSSPPPILHQPEGQVRLGAG